MLKVGILISGRGHNMQALIEAAQKPLSQAEICLVISNDPAAGGLHLADVAGVPKLCINQHDYKDRLSFEGAVDKALRDAGVEFVCLAGFMRVLTPWFVGRWRDRLINMHPSLLPAFVGKDTHKQALDRGVKLAGCTVHFVRDVLDAGPIIGQAVVPVLPDDNPETLANRVLGAELQLYPKILMAIAQGRVSVHEDRVMVRGALAPKGIIENPVLG